MNNNIFNIIIYYILYIILILYSIIFILFYDCTNFLSSTFHPTFHSEERMVNLIIGRECFVGLSIFFV